MDIRKLTYLALLAAVTIIGRIFLQFIPNVQYVTTVIIFATIYLGFKEATLLNIVIMTVSNMFLGFGIWTVYQILSYMVIIIITSILKKEKSFREKITVQSVFCFVSGLIYGLIISIFSATMFSKTSNFVAYYIAGLSFDLMHAVGNLIMYVLLVPILIKLTDKYFESA